MVDFIQYPVAQAIQNIFTSHIPIYHMQIAHKNLMYTVVTTGLFKSFLLWYCFFPYFFVLSFIRLFVHASHIHLGVNALCAYSVSVLCLHFGNVSSHTQAISIKSSSFDILQNVESLNRTQSQLMGLFLKTCVPVVWHHFSVYCLLCVSFWKFHYNFGFIS